MGPTQYLVSLVSSLYLGLNSMSTCPSDARLRLGVGSRWVRAAHVGLLRGGSSATC